LRIDEMGDAGVFGAGDERFSHGVERSGLIGRQGAQRRLRARLTRREHHFGAANREGERADSRALHEGAPFNLVHGYFLPHSAGGTIAAGAGKFNAEANRESSGSCTIRLQSPKAIYSAAACCAVSPDVATGTL
jgi:hypothetical protein